MDLLNRAMSKDFPTYREMTAAQNLLSQKRQDSPNSELTDAEQCIELIQRHGLDGNTQIFDTAYEEEGIQDLVADLGTQNFMKLKE